MNKYFPYVAVLLCAVSNFGTYMWLIGLWPMPSTELLWGRLVFSCFLMIPAMMMMTI